MKKVIDGAVYNTETAKKICGHHMEDSSFEKGTDVKQLKELYKTKSGKYFFFIKNEFPAYIDQNADDLNPRFELEEVEEKKILPVTYELAVQFAREVLTEVPGEKENIAVFFPELLQDGMDEEQKIQKKFYISEKASRYLEMLMQETEHTNSSYIERLITQEYEKQYGN